MFEEPVPAYGTVITSEDSEWLGEHIDNLIAVVHYLSDPTSGLRAPAEACEYILLNSKAGANENIEFVTKNSRPIESGASMYVTPPLALRTTICRCNVDVKKRENAELVARFCSKPKDRIVTACRHLFRASFGGMFQSPWDQDVASYCACLEAAFDIPEGKITERLLAAVQKLLGQGKDIENFMAGAYAIRSVFNHGAPEIEGDDRTEKLRAFREHPAVNIQTLRHICCEAIREQLLDSAVQRASAIEREIARQFSHDRKMIIKRFHSQELWQKTEKSFANKSAGDKICLLKPEEIEEQISDLCRFLNEHSWNFVTQLPTPKKLIAVLTSMACVFGTKAHLSGDEELDGYGQKLFNACKGRCAKSIRRWRHECHAVAERVESDRLYKVVFSVAVRTAGLLERESFRAEFDNWANGETGLPLDRGALA